MFFVWSVKNSRNFVYTSQNSEIFQIIDRKPWPDTLERKRNLPEVDVLSINAFESMGKVFLEKTFKVEDVFRLQNSEREHIFFCVSEKTAVEFDIIQHDNQDKDRQSVTVIMSNCVLLKYVTYM